MNERRNRELELQIADQIKEDSKWTGKKFEDINTDLKAKCLVCSICLDDFSNETLATEYPICKHLFHPNCIKQWK